MTRSNEYVEESQPAATILVIEDEDLIRVSLRSRLEKAGYRTLEASTGMAGIQTLEDEFVDLVLLDYKLPDIDGLSVLGRIKDLESPPVTIMMTAFSSIEGVVEAMQKGAYTYVKKPFEFSEMLEHVKRGLETTWLRREVARLRREAAGPHSRAPALIGRSPAMKEIETLMLRINDAGTSTALILGESGTGKNVLARRLHYTSARADAPFMTITCTDFSENLLESELFGHQKGAFTGAVAAKPGLFELANGGTVFLDEIGDMPLPLQSKMLRFLEERTFRRVGGTKEVEVDVRVVAATNQDLAKLMEEKRFREDLYYRLAVIPVEIPPLRERPEDVEDLANLFLDRFAAEFRKPIQGLTPQALEVLRRHTWPGNVRELRNVLERAAILCTSDRVDLGHLPQELRDDGGVVPTTPAERILGPEGLDFEDLEKGLIRRALDLTEGNQSAAARLLHMSRDQIRYRMEKFGL